MNEDLIFNFKASPFYEDFEKYLKSCRPSIPPYRSGDSLERWIQESARQEGFDLCLSLFNIEVNDD